MQYHKLLLNRALSGTTGGGTSLWQYNGYYVYGNALGGGIVNSFNVRTFLSNPLNRVIVNDFAAYLSANTTQEEWTNIVGSDQELSTIFNSFYETTVMEGQQTDPSLIGTSLVNTGTIQLYGSDHLWDGVAPTAFLENIPLSIDGSSRSSDVVNVTSKFSTEMGYYIPVFITRTHDQDGKDKYDGCQNRLNILLNPEMFPMQEAEVEGERYMPQADSTILTVRNGDPQTRNMTVFSQQSFDSLAKDLISRCYGSECMDNRYCDLLYFSNKRTIEINTIDTQHIQSLLGEAAMGFTSADVLSVLVRELSMNGYPVAPEIYNCLL